MEPIATCEQWQQRRWIRSSLTKAEFEALWEVGYKAGDGYHAHEVLTSGLNKLRAYLDTYKQC